MSAQLLVDVGNTRLKWARLRAGKLGRMGSAPHGSGTPGHYRRLLAPALRGVEAVIVVSVAGRGVDRALAAGIVEASGLTPRFVGSTRHAAGVVNGYREVWRLGADRWVAAIGGWYEPARRGRPVCVVDVGTATTIDLVDARGRHLGGAIVPGPALMVDSLLRGTRGIRRRAAGARRAPPPTPFARSTREALEAGARHAVAALVDRACVAARERTGRRPLLLLTGGAAAEVAPWIRAPHSVTPDLVLRGLAALAATLP